MTMGLGDPLIPLIDQAFGRGKAKRLGRELQSRGVAVSPRQLRRAAYVRVPRTIRETVGRIVIDWLNRSIASDLAAIERAKEALREIDHAQMVARAVARRSSGGRAHQDVAAGSDDRAAEPFLRE